jgi:hypothetical protein
MQCETYSQWYDTLESKSKYYQEYIDSPITKLIYNNSQQDYHALFQTILDSLDHNDTKNEKLIDSIQNFSRADPNDNVNIILQELKKRYPIKLSDASDLLKRYNYYLESKDTHLQFIAENKNDSEQLWRKPEYDNSWRIPLIQSSGTITEHGPIFVDKYGNVSLQSVVNTSVVDPIDDVYDNYNTGETAVLDTTYNSNITSTYTYDNLGNLVDTDVEPTVEPTVDINIDVETAIDTAINTDINPNINPNVDTDVRSLTESVDPAGNIYINPNVILENNTVHDDNHGNDLNYPDDLLKMRRNAVSE